MAKRRYSKNYYKVRKKVYERDNYTCQFPGCKSKHKIVPHHIIRWEDAPLLRENEQNLIILCHTHHSKFVTGNEERYQSMFLRIVRSKYNI